MRIFILFFILLCIQTLTVHAQRDNQLGGWHVLTVKKSFDDSNWDAQAQLHNRNYDVFGDVQLWIYGGSISYSIPETPLKISAGFLHLDFNWPRGEDDNSG